VATSTASCDGAGHCPASATQACAPYVCGGAVCKTTCAVDGDCIAGGYCASGTCVGQLPLGGACSTDNQCQSGHCVDGACCDGACGGQCQACNVPGKLGTCSTVTGVPVGSRPGCVTDGSLCGGTCDGVNPTACRYPTAAQGCRMPSCAGGVETLAAWCDGVGHCPAPMTQACAPLTCGATTCLGNCTTDGDCVAGDFCNAFGQCAPKESLGSACNGASQCASGNCIDGVCCDVACNGQCQACNLVGSIGTCSTVTGAPIGGRPSCGGAGVCGGTCDGMHGFACTFPPATTMCGGASCSGGVAYAASHCDGAGACAAGATTACPGGCSGTACAAPVDGGADGSAPPHDAGADGAAPPHDAGGDGASAPLDGSSADLARADGATGRAPSGGCSTGGRLPRNAPWIAIAMLALLFVRRKLT
jgi:hypothetical protein